MGERIFLAQKEVKLIDFYIIFSTIVQYHIDVNTNQKKVCVSIFKDPVQPNIEWQEIEKLMKSLENSGVHYDEL